jgi:hypothetical protein
VVVPVVAATVLAVDLVVAVVVPVVVPLEVVPPVRALPVLPAKLAPPSTLAAPRTSPALVLKSAHSHEESQVVAAYRSTTNKSSHGENLEREAVDESLWWNQQPLLGAC